MQTLEHSVPAEEATLLLPWFATGTLPGHLAWDIETALGRHATLEWTFAAVREEQAVIVAMNENLGVPSPRALRALFAAIDADGAHPIKSARCN